MNLFATDVYLKTLAEVYYPGRAHSLEVIRVAERYFRTLVIEGRHVVSRCPFMDFLQPLDNPQPAPVREVRYLDRAVLRTLSADEPWQVPGAVHPSPYIDWTGFKYWEDYQALMRARRGHLLQDSRRQRRRAERDLGTLTFRFEDPDPAVFETCLRWKSSQYVATGLRDLFATEENVKLFRKLLERGAVVCSSLRAGQILLATHLGGLADNRHYSWIPAYDPAYRQYSPGRLLLESILEESYHLGHAEFDFLIGDEAYKWDYATHNRAIGELGDPPVSLQLRRKAKRTIKGALSRSAWLSSRVAALKQCLTVNR